MFKTLRKTVLTQVAVFDGCGVSFSMSPQLLDSCLVLLELCYSVSEGVSVLSRRASRWEQQRVPRGVLGLSSSGGAPPEGGEGLCFYNPPPAFQHQTIQLSTSLARWEQSAFGTMNEFLELVENPFQLLKRTLRFPQNPFRLLKRTLRFPQNPFQLLKRTLRFPQNPFQLLKRALRFPQNPFQPLKRTLRFPQNSVILFERTSKNACQMVDIEYYPFVKKKELPLLSLKHLTNKRHKFTRTIMGVVTTIDDYHKTKKR